MDDADKELGKEPRRTGYYVSEQIALLIFARIVEDLVYRLLFTAPIVGHILLYYPLLIAFAIQDNLTLEEILIMLCLAPVICTPPLFYSCIEYQRKDV